MKTVLEQLIDKWESEKGRLMNFISDAFINDAKQMLAKEREGIIEAFVSGDRSDCTSEQNSYDFANKYYDETYNDNK
jgi:hypothetical protein